MREIIIAGIIIACILITGCMVGVKEPIPVTYYYSSTCNDCAKMNVVFDNLTKYHNGEFTLVRYDANIEKVKFYNDQITYKGNGVLPFVILGNASFNGYSQNDDDYLNFETIIINREKFGKK
jgi:hypothetical protein